jgi:hypothetical protein
MLKRMNNKTEWIIRLWFAGMVAFVIGGTLGGTYLFIGIVMGFFTAFLIEPVVQTARLGNQASVYSSYKAMFISLSKNMIIAVFIALVIEQVHLVLGEFGASSHKEPFIFAFAYQMMYFLLLKVMNRFNKSEIED